MIKYSLLEIEDRFACFYFGFKHFDRIFISSIQYHSSFGQGPKNPIVSILISIITLKAGGLKSLSAQLHYKGCFAMSGTFSPVL